MSSTSGDAFYDALDDDDDALDEAEVETVQYQQCARYFYKCYCSDKACSPGNASTELGKDLSMDLWENFVSGMSAGYPSIAEYDANVDVRYSLTARWLQMI